MLYPPVRSWLFLLVFTLLSVPVPANHLAHHFSLAGLGFHIKTLSFIKNSEYFNPFIEGETLAGYQLHPYIQYDALENVTAALGVFMRKNWADPAIFSLVTPTFCIKYQQQAHAFLMGNLQTQRWCNLVPPLYDDRRELTDAPATGLQYQYVNPYMSVDLWLHWLKLLDQPKQLPEELITGLFLEPLVSPLDNKVTIKIPLQLVLYHLGGQGIPIKDFTLWMGALGGCVDVRFEANKLLKYIAFNNYVLANHYVKQVKRPFITGYGWLSQLLVAGDVWSLQGSYWYGVGFSSESIGHPLYQSMALKNHQVVHQEKNRHLIRLQFTWEYQLTKKFRVLLQLHPYYDLHHHCLEHEAGLYIHYTPYG
eukprot:gene71-97_t